MALPDHSSEDALCQEILAQARREAEQLIGRAREESNAMLASADADNRKTRQERLGLAQNEASRHKEMILAMVPVEIARLRSARVETLLQGIYQETRQKLIAHQDVGYPQTLLSLAASAITGMAGNSFTLRLSQVDLDTYGEWLTKELPRRVARSPLQLSIIKATFSDAGAIIEDAEGRQVWDNRLLSRLDRLWPELRRQVAKITALDGELSQPGEVA